MCQNAHGITEMYLIDLCGLAGCLVGICFLHTNILVILYVASNVKRIFVAIWVLSHLIINNGLFIGGPRKKTHGAGHIRIRFVGTIATGMYISVWRWGPRKQPIKPRKTV